MPLRHLLRTRSATAGGLRATLGVAMRAWGADGCGLRVEFHGKRSVLGVKATFLDSISISIKREASLKTRAESALH